MKSLSTNITHLTLIDCSNFLQSIKWETLKKLVYLDINLDERDERDAGLKLCSVSKNLRHLLICGDVQFNVAGILFEAGFGFPELRSLRFRGNYWDHTDTKAFRYCCANSPKLEDIYVFGEFESTETYDTVAQSIGSLLSRPALRKLELDIYDCREPSENQLVVESIINLINCPNEKPKLENLILHPNCPLSSIYHLVNGNYNLKSLELHGKVHQKETVADIIKILNCESGLETIRFSGQCRYSVIPEDFAIRLGGRISRDRFPKLVEDLQKR